MTIQICRICLATDKTLIEISENLLEYFQDICNFTSDFSKHLCCLFCKDTLKSNLDFRNKCIQSNKILQEWMKEKKQKKTDIHSLQKMLKTLNSTKNGSKELADEQSKVGYKDKSNNDFTENPFDVSEIKIESIKSEVENDFIDCGNEHYGSNDKPNCNDEPNYSNDKLNVGNDKLNDGNDKLNDGNDKINDGNDKLNDNNYEINDSNDINDHYLSDEDDNKLLIDCIRETKTLKTKRKANTAKRKVKRVYTRKGINEYLQYEAVFDIQLFKTDEEARREVSQRKVSEPYLSAQYKCLMCYTVYKCDKLLQFHMKWHETSDEFVCDICSMRFSARKAMQCHKSKCHRGKFTCKLCPLITYYGSAMKAHFQKHQGKEFKCHCDRVFNHISSYLSHKRTVHTSSHVCVTCARTFVSEQGLLNHRLRTHQKKSKVDEDATSRCEPCGLVFANQRVYNVHVLNTDSHKDLAKNMIACPYCGLSFVEVTQLKSHKRQFHPKKKDTNDIIKCKLCGCKGQGRSWRRRHYAAQHPSARYLEEVSEARIHMCDQCGKQFTNICLMKEHLNRHRGVKPYVCTVCNASFSSAAKRAKHSSQHASAARVCPHCAALFRSASNLNVHLKTHSGVRRAPSAMEPLPKRH